MTVTSLTNRPPRPPRPQQPDLVAAADVAALAELAANHRGEFTRLRTLELARLTGERPVFHRHRMSEAELADLPDVTDSAGVTLETGSKVRCPDGERGTVERVDRRSRRCVVKRRDGELKMVVAKRLTVRRRPLAPVS